MLDRSGKLGRLLYSEDTDLIVEAAQRQELGVPFMGIVYGHSANVSIGTCVKDLELIMTCSELEEYANSLVRLPL